MSGGVMEWVADCWNPDHTARPATAARGPTATAASASCAAAPGATIQSYSTVTSRLSYDASVRYYTNGFRLARDLP